MNKILTGTFFVIVLGCMSTKEANRSNRFASNPVVAHRGAFKKNGLPENSIASLREAIRLQCAGSEFDVWMTADDSIVLNHDPHFNKLLIEQSNFSSLDSFRLSNGERIPTLRECLRAGLENNTKTRLVLEIKPSGISKNRGKLVAERVVKLVKVLQADVMTVYISFDYDILKQILIVDPKASVQYLNGDKSPAQLQADGIAGADYHFSVFRKNPDWIAEAKKHKILLNAWTVNDAETMDWLLKEGFDFITTNEPELLLEKTKR